MEILGKRHPRKHIRLYRKKYILDRLLNEKIIDIKSLPMSMPMDFREWRKVINWFRIQDVVYLVRFCDGETYIVYKPYLIELVNKLKSLSSKINLRGVSETNLAKNLCIDSLMSAILIKFIDESKIFPLSELDQILKTPNYKVFYNDIECELLEIRPHPKSYCKYRAFWGLGTRIVLFISPRFEFIKKRSYLEILNSGLRIVPVWKLKKLTQ